MKNFIDTIRRQVTEFFGKLTKKQKIIIAVSAVAVLAVIIARHGSTPREVGAKMLISQDGTLTGSVGGGIMEHRTILAAQEMLAGKAPAHQTVHFSADGKNEDAAVAACGGSMELLLTLLETGEALS